MSVLVLNNGSEYNIEWCNGQRGVFSTSLITKKGIADLAIEFSNPEVTKVMKAYLWGLDREPDVYEGYTVLKSIVLDNISPGTALITLVTTQRAELE